MVLEGDTLPPLTLPASSVRNTFLHFTSGDEDESPDGFVPTRQGGWRARTLPASLLSVAASRAAADLSPCEGAGDPAEEAAPPELAAQSQEAGPPSPTEPEPEQLPTLLTSGGAAGRASERPLKAAGGQADSPPSSPIRTSCAPQSSEPDASQDQPEEQREQHAGPGAAVPARGARGRRGSAGECQRTTVVLQNLPLNYRRQMILRMLDCEGFAGKYDFIYVPMDFKTRAGFGYAFVNLVSPAVVPSFWHVFDGYNKWMFPCQKVCRVSWSTPLQGLRAHVNRYRNSPLMHESVPDEYKPVLFTDGARSRFPPPTRCLVAPSQPMAVRDPRARRRRGS